jgi:tRNA A-37 threonylcarbamoyl transferase component Bud32
LVGEVAAHFPQLEIIECLGRGGMGVVYKARQPKLDRLVALKVLAREKERDPHFAERFQREARALARLNHPNIVAVYDFGETGGLYYLLMEFVDGVNLRQLMRGGKMTPEEALGVVPPICEALQYAHKQGIIHRDIKPENILLDKQGRVKIADFGIAKLLDTEGLAEPFTADQQAVGTPHYMAPEQVEKPKSVDHRADIYSLGVVFYEMLTGELPLGKFAPPSQKVRIDVRLDEVVLHALEKDPARRYQQVGEVKTDLDTIANTAGPGPRRAALTPPVTPLSPLGSAWQQVKGPATGLMVTGILSWVMIPFLMLVVALYLEDIRRFAALLAVPLAALVIGGTLFLAGLLMKRLTAYWLVFAASVLAILATPGNLIGLPIGIWALVVLSRREVREAFGKGLPLPQIGSAPPPRHSGAWNVAAVFVAAALVLLAIAVAGLLSAIAIPNFIKARERARQIQQDIRQQVPMFLVHGTVTDAVTGKPIAGARIDDNSSDAHPLREPPHALTDAQGHYELRTGWDEKRYTLRASAPGYETKVFIFLTKNFRMGQSPPTDLRARGRTNSDFALGKGCNSIREALYVSV